MTDIYSKLVDADGNSLIFVRQTTDGTYTRTIWENEPPFVQDIWIQDQVTTRREITITGTLKPGTNMPYANCITAMAALEKLMPATYSRGWELQSGDWNGTTFSQNASYPFQYGSGSTKILNGMVRFNQVAGEAYDVGEINITITMKIGLVF